MAARHEQIRDNRRDAQRRGKFFRASGIGLSDDPFSGLLLPGRRGAHAWEFTWIGLGTHASRVLVLSATARETRAHPSHSALSLPLNNMTRIAMPTINR